MQIPGAFRSCPRPSSPIEAKDIKPIETIYKGYRFRSRLEARWAVFFDALGVKWEYEPEGFELPSGKRYLPDFKVDCYGTRGDLYDESQFVLYIEVKGVMTKEDAEKIKEFSGLKEIDEYFERECWGDECPRINMSPPAC